MAISITSPNADNYVAAGGRLYFKPEGEAEYRDLGDVGSFALGQEVERLDHMSNRAGRKVKDRSDVREQSATLTAVLHEWTPINKSLFYMGALTVDDGAASIDIGSLTEVRGAIRWIGDNSGPSWQLDFPNVSISPNGDLDLVSDDWAGIPVTMEVLWDTANSRFGTAIANFGASPVPENVLLPILDDAQPQEGVEFALEHPGLWTNSPTSYVYKWQADDANDGNFVDLPGEVGATIEPETANIGDALRIGVKAVNDGGEAADWAFSLPSQVILAE